MPPDRDQLRASLDELEDQVTYLELDLIDDPQWTEPSDTSYLNDKDRADPETMANVEAINETNKLIAWFGKDLEGYVGLWRGPKNHPLDSAPVVRLDTEGLFSIVAMNIPDYIAISVDEDDFDDTLEALQDAGFEVSDSAEDIWASVEDMKEPREHHQKLYEAARQRRGLPPLEG